MSNEYLDIEQLYDSVDDIFTEDRKRDKARREEELRALVLDMANILQYESGRKLVWWIISRGNLFTCGYNGKALDMAFESGLRQFAAEVFSLALKANPRILETMINERLKGEKSNG